VSGEQVGLVGLPSAGVLGDRLLAAAVRRVPRGEHVQELDRRAPVDVLGLWQPSFPTPELVSAAADLFPAVVEPAGALAEGPRWEVVVSPGVLRVRSRDYARADRAYERALRHHQADVNIRAAIVAEGEDIADGLPTRGRIVGWSRRSRANLVARLSDLDYTRLYGRYSTCSDCGTDYSERLDRCPACRSPRSVSADRSGRLPAMLTLTYPGDWLSVAPDAETVKRHFWALCKRYERAWGEPLIGPWKMEFQRRGAPHFHISTTPPMRFVELYDPDAGRVRQVDFRAWLSITWANVVGHSDLEQRRRHRLAGTGVDYAEGIKVADPRRMAIYFAKYGTAGGKEYQHQVPPEWCGARLRCDDCVAEYDEHGADPCPDCGSYSAELIELATGTGRFWGTGACAQSSPSARSPRMSGSTPAGSCVAGTGPRG
jgi:hypothetical protein